MKIANKKAEDRSRKIIAEAIEFLGSWNDSDPEGFEAEQERRWQDMQSRGLR